MPKKETTKKEETEIKKDVVKELKEKVLVELNKEIKTTITDSTAKFKEDLKEEISEDIQNEVANIMKKEEKRILKGKSFSIFKRDAIIVVLLGIVCYFGYCLYDVKYFEFMKSECEKNGTCTVIENSNPDNSTTKPEEIVKDTNWYIENYGYLLDNVKLTLNADNVNAYYLYSNDYEVSDIKSNYLLNMAYGKLDKKSIKTNSQTITVEGDDLKNAFVSLFGTESFYKAGTFTYNCLRFTYNEEKNRYTAENTKCSESNKEIVEEIENMYEEGDVLYIQTSAAIYDNIENSFYTFDNLFEPAVSNTIKEDLKKNTKKFNKYQYQFRKVEGIYYLSSIIKLK